MPRGFRIPLLMCGQIERLSNESFAMFAARKLKTSWVCAVKVKMSCEFFRYYANHILKLTVCDYFVHDACQEFAVPNCVEKATFDVAKTLIDARQGTAHHFQEGNLPNNSKCVKCKKTCWSPDCLTGMRCQWCGMSAHSSCLPNLPACQSVCQFGLLEPIFLPPNAISIPRTQLTEDKVISKSHALMQARE